MANRIKINVEQLEEVVGGAIVWDPNGTCWDKKHPDIIYHFDIYKFEEIYLYLQQYNGGGAHDLSSLEMLKDAGYVW